MGKESNLYARVQKGLPMFHWQRFEDSCSTGIPDLNGCDDGVEVWIEAKVADAKGRVDVRPAQIAWLTRRWAAGGLAWLLVERDDALRLYRGCDAADVALSSTAVLPWHRWPARRTPWESVRAYISRR